MRQEEPIPPLDAILDGSGVRYYSKRTRALTSLEQKLKVAREAFNATRKQLGHPDPPRISPASGAPPARTTTPAPLSSAALRRELRRKATEAASARDAALAAVAPPREPTAASSTAAAAAANASASATPGDLSGRSSRRSRPGVRDSEFRHFADSLAGPGRGPIVVAQPYHTEARTYLNLSLLPTSVKELAADSGLYYTPAGTTRGSVGGSGACGGGTGRGLRDGMIRYYQPDLALDREEKQRAADTDMAQRLARAQTTLDSHIQSLVARWGPTFLDRLVAATARQGPGEGHGGGSPGGGSRPPNRLSIGGAAGVGGKPSGHHKLNLVAGGTEVPISSADAAYEYDKVRTTLGNGHGHCHPRGSVGPNTMERLSYLAEQLKVPVEALVALLRKSPSSGERRRSSSTKRHSTTPITSVVGVRRSRRVELQPRKNVVLSREGQPPSQPSPSGGAPPATAADGGQTDGSTGPSGVSITNGAAAAFGGGGGRILLEADAGVGPGSGAGAAESPSRGVSAIGMRPSSVGAGVAFGLHVTNTGAAALGGGAGAGGSGVPPPVVGEPVTRPSRRGLRSSVTTVLQASAVVSAMEGQGNAACRDPAQVQVQVQGTQSLPVMATGAEALAVAAAAVFASRAVSRISVPELGMASAITAAAGIPAADIGGADSSQSPATVAMEVPDTPVAQLLTTTTQAGPGEPSADMALPTVLPGTTSTSGAVSALAEGALPGAAPPSHTVSLSDPTAAAAGVTSATSPTGHRSPPRAGARLPGASGWTTTTATATTAAPHLDRLSLRDVLTAEPHPADHGLPTLYHHRSGLTVAALGRAVPPGPSLEGLQPADPRKGELEAASRAALETLARRHGDLHHRHHHHGNAHRELSSSRGGSASTGGGVQHSRPGTSGSMGGGSMQRYGGHRGRPGSRAGSAHARNRRRSYVGGGGSSSPPRSKAQEEMLGSGVDGGLNFIGGDSSGEDRVSDGDSDDTGVGGRGSGLSGGGGGGAGGGASRTRLRGRRARRSGSRPSGVGKAARRDRDRDQDYDRNSRGAAQSSPHATVVVVVTTTTTVSGGDEAAAAALSTAITTSNQDVRRSSIAGGGGGRPSSRPSSRQGGRQRLAAGVTTHEYDANDSAVDGSSDMRRLSEMADAVGMSVGGQHAHTQPHPHPHAHSYHHVNSPHHTYTQPPQHQRRRRRASTPRSSGSVGRLPRMYTSSSSSSSSTDNSSTTDEDVDNEDTDTGMTATGNTSDPRMRCDSYGTSVSHVSTPLSAAPGQGPLFAWSTAGLVAGAPDGSDASRPASPSLLSSRTLPHFNLQPSSSNNLPATAAPAPAARSQRSPHSPRGCNAPPPQPRTRYADPPTPPPIPPHHGLSRHYKLAGSRWNPGAPGALRPGYGSESDYVAGTYNPLLMARVSAARELSAMLGEEITVDYRSPLQPASRGTPASSQPRSHTPGSVTHSQTLQQQSGGGGEGTIAQSGTGGTRKEGLIGTSNRSAASGLSFTAVGSGGGGSGGGGGAVPHSAGSSSLLPTPFASPPSRGGFDLSSFTPAGRAAAAQAKTAAAIADMLNPVSRAVANTAVLAGELHANLPPPLQILAGSSYNSTQPHHPFREIAPLSPCASPRASAVTTTVGNKQVPQVSSRRPLPGQTVGSGGGPGGSSSGEATTRRVMITPMRSHRSPRRATLDLMDTEECVASSVLRPSQSVWGREDLDDVDILLTSPQHHGGATGPWATGSTVHVLKSAAMTPRGTAGRSRGIVAGGGGGGGGGGSGGGTALVAGAPAAVLPLSVSGLTSLPGSLSERRATTAPAGPRPGTGATTGATTTTSGAGAAAAATTMPAVRAPEPRLWRGDPRALEAAFPGAEKVYRLVTDMQANARLLREVEREITPVEFRSRLRRGVVL